jgi:hypothetical protein
MLSGWLTFCSHELAKEHHEQREQLVHRAVALGLHSCAHRGVVRLDCSREVMRERDVEQAVCVEEGIGVWWLGERTGDGEREKDKQSAVNIDFA